MRSTPCLAPRWLLVVLVVLIGGPAFAEESAEDILAKARALESGRNDYLQARRYYETLLVPDSRFTLTLEQRAQALCGAARCLKLEGKLEKAKQYWERIGADARLPKEAHEYAQKELDDYRRTHPAPTPDQAAMAKRRAELEADRVKKQNRLVEQAKRARERGEFDTALQRVYAALGMDASYAPAVAEHARILAARPDHATLLESVLHFMQSKELDEYRNLLATVRTLRERGVAAHDAKDLVKADRLLRDGIQRIDESGFLEMGGPRYTESLLPMRDRLVTWLQQVHAQGAKAELEFRPIPDAPDFTERTAGLQGQFYAFLAKLFPPRDAQDSMRFFSFASGRRGGRLPLLSSSFEHGQRVSQQRSTSTRAGWAHRHIRRRIGSAWTDPLAPGGSAAPARRILSRFGDLLAVEHRADVMRRIEALRTSFRSPPPALDVDIHVFAARAGGYPQATEKLGLRATGGSDGLTLIHRDALVAQCAEQLGTLDRVVPLGKVHVKLQDTSSTELILSQLTADHPMYAGLPPPQLVVPTDVAAYGLWLDLYAEDMSEAEHGVARCAVSLRARTRMPTHSAVLPRTGPDKLPHTRLARLGEHEHNADVELPHFGTLVVLGLPNPFVPSNAEAPELILLIGAHRADEATPDPPPGQDQRIVPDPYRQRDYDLGPLATEILDHEIDEEWPELASADLLSRPDRVLGRNRYLASILAVRAGLEDEGDDTVAISDGRCVATLTAEQHVRLARAVRSVRTHEATLYRVEAAWREIPAADWTRWADQQGNQEGGMRRVRIAADAPTPIDGLQDKGRLFAGKAATLARATQRIGIRRLQGRSVVRDIRIVPDASGGTRLLPEMASVDQGIVLEVRPGMESDGVRSVVMRVRTAQWERIESRAHPGTDVAKIEVPVWKRSGGAARIDARLTEIVSDDDAIVFGMPVVGNAMRTLVVRVRVQKIR